MKNPPVQHQPRQGKVVRGAVGENLLRTDRKDRLVVDSRSEYENVVTIFHAFLLLTLLAGMHKAMDVTPSIAWRKEA